MNQNPMRSFLSKLDPAAVKGALVAMDASDVVALMTGGGEPPAPPPPKPVSAPPPQAKKGRGGSRPKGKGAAPDTKKPGKGGSKKGTPARSAVEIVYQELIGQRSVAIGEVLAATGLPRGAVESALKTLIDDGRAFKAGPRRSRHIRYAVTQEAANEEAARALAASKP